MGNLLNDINNIGNLLNDIDKYRKLVELYEKNNNNKIK